jgi:DNA-binding NarL/FixJ family response regulator
MIKIAITDDHELVRRGVADMIATINGMTLSNGWPNAADTLKGLELERPDILLLDINLPDMQGYELCRKLRILYPQLPVIALSTFDQSVVVHDMMNAGSRGYLTKNASAEEIEAAVKEVLLGRIYLPERIESRFKKQQEEGRSVRLTRREETILRLVAAELTTTEIAEKLFIAERTVETHRTNLYQKLGVKNIAGLVREAIRRGLVS